MNPLDYSSGKAGPQISVQRTLLKKKSKPGTTPTPEGLGPQHLTWGGQKFTKNQQSRRKRQGTQGGANGCIAREKYKTNRGKTHHLQTQAHKPTARRQQSLLLFRSSDPCWHYFTQPVASSAANTPWNLQLATRVPLDRLLLGHRKSHFIFTLVLVSGNRKFMHHVKDIVRCEVMPALHVTAIERKHVAFSSIACPGHSLYTGCVALSEEIKAHSSSIAWLCVPV